MQAAQVAVGQQRRDHGQQDRRPDQCPAEADQAAADPDHADADQPLAHRAPAQRGQDVDLDREDGDRPELRFGQPVRDDHAEQPVDEQRQHAARHAGHRPRAALGQAEPLAGIGLGLGLRRGGLVRVGGGRGGQLRGARLRGTRLRGTRLRGTRLRGARLRGAGGRGASLRRASRSGGASAAAVTGLSGHLTTVSVPRRNASSGPRHKPVPPGRAPGSAIIEVP